MAFGNGRLYASPLVWCLLPSIGLSLSKEGSIVDGSDIHEEVVSSFVAGRNLRRRRLQSSGTHDYSQSFHYFNKLTLLDASLVESLLPIDSYPLDNETAHILKTMSLGDSPVTQVDMPSNRAKREIWGLGGLPTFPGDPAFWDELQAVTEMQVLRRGNGSTPFRLPDIWEGFDIGQVAEAVNGEYPGYWHAKLLESFWKQGMQMDYSVMPFNSVVDFVGNTIRCAELNMWAVAEVCPTNFLVKWTVGRLRPEEAAFQIEKDLFPDVPEELSQLVKSMNLKTPEEYTAYRQGSPTHPSWPAMHSAAGQASLWLATVADLTPEQYCQTLLMDYAVSYARTVAGVHYTTDNVAGLNLGQRLVAKGLPKRLSESFGVSEAAVLEKANTLRFDWDSFNPEDCSADYSGFRDL